MKLFGYFRSSASYRVRIALNLKGLAHDAAFVHLARHEQFDPGYAALNRQNLIPTLEVEGHALTQSLAIVEYLEECHPEPPLLPTGAIERARVRAMAQAIACEIQPLNNTRVMIFLGESLDRNQAQRNRWAAHWIDVGFRGLETRLVASPSTGIFCHGETPGLADICLVPQAYNARRLDMDLGAYPTIQRIERTCLELAAFDAARPENQPDAE
jgi:maleylacetoacetate isomerase